MSKSSRVDKVPDVDVREFLTNKGIWWEEAKSADWIKLHCLFPAHDDDNPSFFINTADMAFNCYGCGKKGTWTELCEEMGWDVEAIIPNYDQIRASAFNEARKVFALQMEIVPESPHVYFHMPVGFKEITVEKIADGNSLHINASEYIVAERGLNMSVVKEFHMGVTNEIDPDYRGAYKDRVIVPVHDESGEVVWPEGRLFRSGAGTDKRPKYYRPKGARSDAFLFNYHRVREAGEDWLIVVEGILDAISIHHWGFPATATFGAGISDRQLALISKFREIYFCFDLDTAGIEAWKEYEGQFKDAGIILKRVMIPLGKDANSIGEQAFIGTLQSASQIQY